MFTIVVIGFLALWRTIARLERRVDDLLSETQRLIERPLEFQEVHSDALPQLEAKTSLPTATLLTRSRR